MHENIISVSVQASVKNQRRVHERAGVHKTAALTDLHALNVEDKAAIEDLESKSRFAAEYQNLVVSDLVSEAHIGGHPFGFVDEAGWNFLPNVAADVVALNCVNNLLLVNATAKCKNVVVFETAKRDSSARHFEGVNLLPLVFLGVVLLAIAVDDIVHERAHNVDEAVNAADGVVCVRAIHIRHAHKGRKDLIVTKAGVQVHIVVFDVATGKVD